MTQQPDDRPPEEPNNGSSDVERAWDEDAMWADIVANYGDRPEMGTTSGDQDPRAEERARRAPRNPPPKNLFDRSFIESTTEPARELNTEASWNDEGHFVPPPPPPLPVVEPRRKLAWLGLFGAPALMLLGVVLGWTFPSWVSAVLVASFVGGFIYLVATMPRRRPGDWSGDDGAVV
jgi:hypothetical protein